MNNDESSVFLARGRSQTFSSFLQEMAAQNKQIVVSHPTVTDFDAHKERRALHGGVPEERRRRFSLEGRQTRTES